MAVKLTRLTYNIAIQLHLVSAVPFVVLARRGQAVRNFLDTPSYSVQVLFYADDSFRKEN
jgi:hypothetical protein